MRDIEQKISPLVQSMFPSFYLEEGPNFIAFVKAYYEWLETNFQLLTLEDNTNFNVGDTVVQQDVTGTITSYVGSDILVQIDGFNTFKCYNTCSELIPVTSSSGGSSYILAGGTTKRLSPIYMARNLTKLRDIDKTLDIFVVNFKEKYLKNIEFDISTNKNLLVKNSLDLYRSKGTERSIDLFFRLVYGIKADVEYPGERLFTLSAGEWYSPSYIEISSESVQRNIELVGKQIEGVTSGSTAFVEKYVKRKINSGFVHLLYISNIRGEFLKNELLKSDVAFIDSPKVLGSLSSVLIDNGGINYQIGDVVTFTSQSGEKGLARVTSVRDKTGTVDFELLEGGWGYSVSANSITPYTTSDRTQTLVSDKLLTLDNIECGNSVYSISLVNQGLSYTDADTVTIVSPTANATARIVTGGGGAITDVILTNPGSGFFTTNPTIQVTSGAGAGATFTIEYKDPKQYFRLLDNVSQQQTNTDGKLLYNSPGGFITLTTVTDTISVNDVLYQIGNNGESASAKVTGVVSSSLVSTVLKIDSITGVFAKHKPVYVLNSPITAQFVNISLTIGVGQISNAYSRDSSIYFKHSGTKATIISESSGSGADYEVGSVSNPQTVYLNTDLLSNTAIRSLTLVGSTTFGLPKNPESNINSVIFSALEFKPFTLGSVATLADLNPGSEYSANPKTLSYQPYLLGHNLKDYIFKIENLDRSFASNEMIIQSYDVEKYTVALSSPTPVRVGEKIYTANSSNPLITSGIVKSVNLTSNVIVISDMSEPITTSQNLYSFSNTLINIGITSSESFIEETTAKAIIKNASDTEIYAKRIQYEDLFRYDIPVQGSKSGATADIIEIAEDSSTLPIGLNADVKGTADSIEGSIANLKVIDSGFGFQDNQSLVFTSGTNSSTGEATSTTTGIGSGIGYYKTSKGFLSSLSKLHDGDYYQEYSYEVISRIPIDKYSTMLKKVMHVAGTRFFGSILIDSVINSNTSVINSELMIMDGSSPYVIQDRSIIDVEDRSNITIEIRE